MHYSTSCNTQFGAPEDGRDHRAKYVELIGIINKPVLLKLVGVYIIYILSYKPCIILYLRLPHLITVNFLLFIKSQLTTYAQKPST